VTYKSIRGEQMKNRGEQRGKGDEEGKGDVLVIGRRERKETGETDRKRCKMTPWTTGMTGTLSWITLMIDIIILQVLTSVIHYTFI
jgi:hypothetical protein